MAKGVNSRNEKQVAAWLPKEFVGEFKVFVKKLNTGNGGIRKITEREVVYEALMDYMKRHKEKTAKAV